MFQSRFHRLKLLFRSQLIYILKYMKKEIGIAIS